MAVAEYKTYQPKNRKDWRKWLEKNHSSEPGVWLIYYKKQSGKKSVVYDEAVEEALCFGWIDSLPRKLDEERSMLKFTPRKPKSMWSDLNKKKIKKMIKLRLMTEAGMAKIEKAKKDGSWNILSSLSQNADTNNLPADLLKAFGRNKKALENFRDFGVSYRKQFLFWLESAKRPETRAARIKQTVLMSAANKRPGVKGFKL